MRAPLVVRQMQDDFALLEVIYMDYARLTAGG